MSASFTSPTHCRSSKLKMELCAFAVKNQKFIFPILFEVLNLLTNQTLRCKLKLKLLGYSLLKEWNPWQLLIYFTSLNDFSGATED